MLPKEAAIALKAAHVGCGLTGIFAQTYIVFADSDHQKCFKLKAPGGGLILKSTLQSASKC